MRRRLHCNDPATYALFSALPSRSTAGLLVLTMCLLGCPPVGQGLAPTAGAIDYQRDARIALAVPGVDAHVNAAGGNLMVRRVDLSIDTRLGQREIGAVYNSSLGAWRWSFELHYGTALFTDETGATHDISDVEDGEAIPGTHWVKLDAYHIKTKSGRVYSFDLAHRLQSIHRGQATWPRLEHVHGPVGAEMRTLRIHQCQAPGSCENVYSVRYDEQGRVVAIDDRAGRRAEFVWADGRLVSARDGLDVEEGRRGWVYEYSGDLLRAMTSGDGERTEIDYDGRRVAQVSRIGEGDPTDTFHYSGEVDGLYATRHWNALAHERIYRYDAERRLHEIWNMAVDERATWSWSGRRPVSRTEPDGTTRFFAWTDDDLVREVLPSGNLRQLRYAADGTDRDDPPHRPVLRIDDSVGLVEAHSYDAAGRRVGSTNGSGETVTFAFDADANLASITSPSGTVTELVGYASHGHADVIRRPGNLIAEHIRLHDGVGNRVRGGSVGSPGPAGVGVRSFDADRNLRSIALDEGGQIVIDVRSDGRRTRITRPGGDDHEMLYDALGRLVARRERVGGSWHTTSFEYDLVGNQTAIERPNGMRQEYSFDAAARIVRVRNLRDGALESEARFTHANGRLVSSHDSLRGGKEVPSYDAGGRVVALEHPSGRSTTYGYDERSRRTSEAWLDENGALVRIVHLAYDGADRNVEIRDGLTSVLARDYVEGRLAQLRYGNGFVRRHDYAPDDGSLRSTETRDASGNVVESTLLTRTLEWPGVELTVRTTTAGGVAATTQESYRLSPFHHGGWATNRPRVTHYTGASADFDLRYDARSNLVAEGTTSFQYNEEGNRLQAIDPDGGTPTAYAYDAAGFATSRGGVEITWQANGLMASHGLDRFEWDVLGRPISATVDGTTTRSGFGGSVTTDDAGVPIRVDLEEVSIDLQGGGRLYRHLDFRGNVKFTSDDAGATRSHYRYSPFGLEEIFGATDDPLRFAARPEIGDLMLMGARIYDPAAGRFLSPDPVFQVVNQYAYTLGNPVQFHDRSGRAALDQAGAAAPGLTTTQTLAVVGNAFLLAAAISALTGNMPLAATLGLTGMILVIMGSMDMGRRTRRRKDRRVLRFA